jgi:3-deoxy-manno-octulosonate cytidylyltransferase (CMP-KDO synthetase)
MKVMAVIPARLAATRFPDKPLFPILGLPMIEHVRRRVSLSPLLSDVIVATCDKKIFDVVSKNGGKAVMTSDRHERCTDRIAEASLGLTADVIVNVQGDEPLFSPSMIEELLAPLQEDPLLPCSNLMTRITDDEEFHSPHTVKVVVDRFNNLLYASREPIPSPKKTDTRDYVRWKQLGIIAFRSDFLQKFCRLPPTPLEEIESVDMNRALEHGYVVRMVPTTARMIGVDTPEQIREVEALLSKDPLFKNYT